MIATLAEQYIARGWHVFPLAPRSKVPATSHGFKDATVDPEQVQRWFGNGANYNVGIATGRVSGFFVLDIDPRHAGDETLGALERKHGKLPDTVRALTGGADQGQHLLFKYPEGRPVSCSAPGDGIEVKGDGGYIVAAPSIHPSGNPYRWDVGALPSETEIADAPAWLLDALKADSPKSTLQPIDGTDASDTVLGEAFRLSTMLGAALPGGKRMVVCPWANEHSDDRGKGQDSSTVIMPPTTAAKWGAFCCSHAHCAGRRFEDVLAALPAAHVQAAREKYTPTILVKTGLRHEAVDLAVRTLVRNPGECFVQETTLVHVVNAEAPDPTDRAPIKEGTPIIMPLPIALLSKRFGEIVRWEKKDARVKPEGTKRTDPDKAVVSTVHQHQQWPGMRPLVGIAETPILHMSGEVTAHGYDRRSKYLVGGSGIRIPERATQADAAKALQKLLYPFSQFEFSIEAMRYVVIAAAATILLRPAIAGPVPAFAFDAPEKASGKTLLAWCASIIGTGRKAGGATWPVRQTTRGGATCEEELEKMLAAYTIRGAPEIFFDNVKRGVAFGCAPMEKFLTQTRNSFRVLGESTQPDLETRAVVIVTANNLCISEDCTRRTVLARINPPENPSKRTGFHCYPLDGWCLEHRDELAGAIFTIARAWIDAGRPDGDVGPLASFDEWTAIARMLVFAGGLDVKSCVPEDDVDRSDDRGAEITFVTELHGWLKATGALERGTTGKELIGALYPDGKPPRAGDAPDGWADLRTAIEAVSTCRNGVPDPRSLGDRMRYSREKWLAGYRLVKAGETHKVARWTVKNG